MLPLTAGWAKLLGLFGDGAVDPWNIRPLIAKSEGPHGCSFGCGDAEAATNPPPWTWSTSGRTVAPLPCAAFGRYTRTRSLRLASATSCHWISAPRSGIPGDHPRHPAPSSCQPPMCNDLPRTTDLFS